MWSTTRMKARRWGGQCTLGDAGVRARRFSPGRTRAATEVVGRSVRVWNIETGECVHQMVGHTERVWGLAWSRDGQRILSGAWDNTARLWDVTTGKCLRVLEGHSGFV